MMKIKLVQILLITTLVGCDYVDDRLVITNSTTKPVAIEFSNSSTFLESEKPDYYIATALQPNETRSFSRPGSTEAWVAYVKMSGSKKLSFYFYDIDTIKKYMDMEYINKNKLYNKVDYSEEELNKIKWVIKYP